MPAPDDDAWRQIVENYGDRPHVDDLPEESVNDHQPDQGPIEDHYEPPPALRVGLARGPRGAAWLGTIGAPALLICALITGIGIPGWLALIAVFAFLIGTGYLIATMTRHDTRDPWDDGSRV